MLADKRAKRTISTSTAIFFDSAFLLENCSLASISSSSLLSSLATSGENRTPGPDPLEGAGEVMMGLGDDPAERRGGDAVSSRLLA